MRILPVVLFTLGAIASFLSGCSKQDDPAVAAKTATTVTTPAITAVAPAARTRPSACNLVTQAEMSAILGGAVIAAAGGNERPPSSTECIYSSPAGPSPYAELQVDWGGGDPQALGAAAGLAKGVVAGAVDSLQGLGERAYQVTAEQVFISTGGNLMMIRFLPKSGDVIPKARRIYETARSKM